MSNTDSESRVPSGARGDGGAGLRPVGAVAGQWRARIAVDAMGGDGAPDEIVAGALVAAGDGLTPILFGPAGLETAGLELVEAPDAIGMREKPSEAVRAKPDSSLVAACRAVADGRADAVVSAGNTGAMLAAGLIHLRRLPGVLRPAIAVVIPTAKGPTLLLDAGANADARPEHLLQFAGMGSIFARELLERANPKVRLLSIGEEAEKGNQLTLEAHALLAGGEVGFAGNVESRDLLAGAADVVVCDGFTGNIALKLLEGTIATLLDALRSEIEATPRGRLGGLLIRPAAQRLRERLDPDTYGGAYLLGLRGLSVIAHGNSSRQAIANAIRLAARGVERDVVARLAARMPGRRSATTV
ncbi:MAG: phosphate acyltransferase PlsX [Gaiellaceae bacterium MAG52_C11]|nr:phosphate acyltransferase PlsX [Candidatus Gaiellasilicea maunaloa]